MSPERYAWREFSADRPSVFHLPVGDAWWWNSTDEQAVLDTSTWLHRSGSHVYVHRNVSALDVVPSPSGLSLRPPPLATRRNHLWSHPRGPLPFGAERARRFWTSPCGTTRLWDDDFWLYRQHAGHDPVALGRVRAEDGVLIGPRGAVLLSRDDVFLAGASPDGPLLSLGTSTEGTCWGVRWSADGSTATLSGPESARVDLRTATMHPAPRWPANAAGTASLNPEQTALTTPHGVTPLPTCSTAVLGSLLAGPGGVSWDLARGTPLFSHPVWRLGATVPVNEKRFFTVDYESGQGEWLDPRSGELLGEVQLLLGEDELVEEGWPVEDAALIALSSGRVLAVRPDGIRETQAEPPDPEPRSRVRLPVPWDSAARVGHHTWVWSESGLLIALPAEA